MRKKLIAGLCGIICLALITVAVIFSMTNQVYADDGSVGNTVWFGSYWQDKVTDQDEIDVLDKTEFTDGMATVSGVRFVYSKGNYYKDKAIQWRVLKDNGSSLTLMSEKSLDTRPFGTDVTSEYDYWKDCSSRVFLNGDFYNAAFSESEKQDIITTDVVYHEEDKDGKFDVHTSDKVYLLHEDELAGYGLTEASAAVVPTDFAARERDSMTFKSSQWWLRGDSYFSYGNIKNVFVFENGEIGSWYPTYHKGIRPVIEIKKNSSMVKTEEPEVKSVAGCKIVFDANGGYSSVSGKMVKSGEKYGTLPVAKRSGYTFKGWFTGKRFGTKVTSSTVLNSQKKEIVLYAHWKEHKYTIKFNANGGKGSMSPMKTLFCGTRYVLKKNKYTKSGYRFTGWSTKKKGPIIYTDGASFTNATTKNNGKVTLYAVWSKKTSSKKYTIKYKANGGKGSMSASKGLIYGRTYKLKSNKFKRDGYVFAGWSKTSGGNVKYHNKEAVRNLSSKNGGKVTLYAVWKPASESTGIVSAPKVYGCVIGGCNRKDNGYTHQAATDFYKMLCKNKIKGHVTEKSNIHIHNLAASAPARYELDNFISSDFAETTSKDISFVYYAGHGMGGGPDGEGQGIVLRNLEKEDYSQAYGYTEFLEMLGNNINGKIVLITETCYSGGFVKAVPKTSVKDRICIFTSCAANQLTSSTQKFGMEEGWDWLMDASARNFAAAVVDAFSPDDTLYQCFSYTMKKGLTKKKTNFYPADINKDSVVTCEEFSAYLRSNMPELTDELPQFYLGKLRKQIFFG